MNDRLKNYYKNNFLFAGHQMMMPQAGEKFKHACGQCKYYVNVIGQQENRRICLAGVKAYRQRQKRVPESIDIVELMFLLGKEALQALASQGDHNMACGTFELRM